MHKVLILGGSGLVGQAIISHGFPEELRVTNKSIINYLIREGHADV